MNTTVANIPIGKIEPNPENPRKKINGDELAELAQSIRSVGLLQPITVRQRFFFLEGIPVDDTVYYEIVCGHRRFEAAKLAGLEEIPCIVRALSDDEAYEIMVTENLQRKDVDPFDEAAAFETLKNRGYDTDTLAEKFGKSKSYVFSRIKLRSLLPEFVVRFEEGSLDLSHCLILARLDASFQKKLLNERYSGGYNDLSGKSVKELKLAIQGLGMPLGAARFNTEECTGCPHNTGCASLFLDVTASTCMNPECYCRKFVGAVYPRFETVRRRNPDFFICDNWDLSRVSNECDKALLKKLRQEGFKFIKGNEYGRKRLNRDSADRFNIDHPEICAFDFGWNGFLGPKMEKQDPDSSTQHKWKSDYTLNRLANNREDVIKEQSNRIALDSIFNADLAGKTIPVESLLRAMLLHMIPEDGGIAESLGISDVSDTVEVRAAVNAMSSHKVVCTVAQLFTQVVNDDYDTTIIQQMFPEAFENAREKAEKKFLNRARECWNGYGEVTDEMVEDDLKERLEKAGSNE